jgi:hypothetical protein
MTNCGSVIGMAFPPNLPGVITTSAKFIWIDLALLREYPFLAHKAGQRLFRSSKGYRRRFARRCVLRNAK